MSALTQEGESEYKLVQEGVWITVKNVSVLLSLEDDQVKVGFYPLDHEEMEPLVSLSVPAEAAFKYKIEHCEVCGGPVVFESDDLLGLREYEICSSCGKKLCPSHALTIGDAYDTFYCPDCYSIIMMKGAPDAQSDA